MPPQAPASPETDFQGLANNPDFISLPDGEKMKVLVQTNRDFAMLPMAERMKVMGALRPQAQVPPKPNMKAPGYVAGMGRVAAGMKGAEILGTPQGAIQPIPLDRAMADPALGEKPLGTGEALAYTAPILAGPWLGKLGMVKGVLGAGGIGAASQAIGDTIDAMRGTDGPQTSGAVVDKALDAGTTQGGYELMGRLMAKPVQWLMTAFAPKDAASRAVLRLNDREKLHMTGPEISNSRVGQNVQEAMSTGLFAHPVAEAGQEATKKAATEAIGRQLDNLAPYAERSQVGTNVAKALDVASDVYHQEGGRRIESAITNAEKQNKMVNLAPLKDAIRQEILTKQKGEVYQNPATFLPKEFQDVYNLILANPDQITPRQAQTIADRLRNFKANPQALMPSPADATASHFYGQLVQQMKQDLPPDYGAAQQFYKSQVGDLFSKDRSTLQALREMAVKEPEKLVAAIGPQDVSKVRALRQALLGYGQYSPQMRQLGEDAYKQLQRSYAEQQLLRGENGVFGLNDRLKQTSQPVLNELFGASPEGRAALARMRSIGMAMDRINSLPGQSRWGTWAAIHGLAAAMGGGVGYATHDPAASLMTTAGVESLPALLTKIFYSDKATSFFMRGVAGMMRDAELGRMPAAQVLLNKTGSGLEKATPYVGTGAADIIRAFELADAANRPAPATATSAAQKPQASKASAAPQK